MSNFTKPNTSKIKNQENTSLKLQTINEQEDNDVVFMIKLPDEADNYRVVW